MGKRSNRRRQQKKQQGKPYLYGGMALVVLVVAGTIGYTIFSHPPEVSASRLALDPVIGPEDADVTIYEFGAYGCHACRANHQTGNIDFILEHIVENPAYEGRVNFVFVNFPVISPRVDRIGAEAAQCALDQGNEAFWALHNAIYDMSDAEFSRYTNTEAFVRLANEVGIDGAALGTCLDTDAHERTVQHHEERSRRARVLGTPTFQVNGRTVNIQSLEAAVRRALGLG